MTRNDAKMDDYGATLRNAQVSIKNLENQIRKLVRVSIESPHGSISSNIEANPR